MAKKLSEKERRRLAADFDPPAGAEAPPAPPLTGKARVRVTASLTESQHAMLKTLSARLRLPMSRVLGEAVEALHQKEQP